MASKRHVRAARCGAKQRHPSQEAASRHLRHLLYAEGDDHLGTYRCRYCGHWHVGHVPKQAFN